MTFKLPEDLKDWYALSCPTAGLRFDARTLELMDTNHDGHIRSDEVRAALDFLTAKGVSLDALFAPDSKDEERLADVMAKAADLEKLAPSPEEAAALAAWEAQGKEPTVAVCGEKTAAAEAALAAVESTVDAFFTPPEDLPLVTEQPDVALPLADHLNPKHLEAILAFAEQCVKPVLGERASLSRLDWKAVKAAFAPYRAWVAAKPVVNAAAKRELEEQERLLRYRLYLGEFLVNYVSMDCLYEGKEPAIFQTGILRIDGKEMNLCFHVDAEAAHSALVDRSRCCVIYLHLARPGEGAERCICAVVTAGTVSGLYVGRNGVFYDRDGSDWEAVITKVVEAQVSLAEAFWAPWRKMGEGISAAVKKFLEKKQAKTTVVVPMGATAPASQPKEGGGAAMASSVAAIGIGIGMVGAAAASVMSAIKGMGPWQFLGALIAIVLLVSLPSVILTWFKLRKRDLGAILNACGWAVNREIRFSMNRARGFTKCARTSVWWLYALLLALVLGLAAWTWWCHFGPKDEYKTTEAPVVAVPVNQEAK